METKIYAVITGDLVESASIKGDFQQEINRIAEDIMKFLHADFRLEIFRGDSFQALLGDPSVALLAAILIRTGLRRNTRGKGLENSWDARVAIGMGTINRVSLKRGKSLAAMNGDAFVRSGHSLDRMKKEGTLLRISTGSTALDNEFAAVCPLVDALMSRWTISQAEAIYLHLLRRMTQQAIGLQLQTSQRAIGQRMAAGKLDNLKPLLNRFKQEILWT